MSSQELRAIFAQHGLRLSKKREEVYQVLWGCESHPSAEELMGLVRSIDPNISQATIYNTLDTLVECGLARRIPSRTAGGACRYDGNTAEHVHMVLENGRMIDVPMDLSQKLLDSMPVSVLEEITTRTGIELSGIKIELQGQSTPEPSVLGS